MMNILENIYFNPEHPAAFGDRKKLLKYAKEVDSSITDNDVKNWLSSKFEYTLYKPTRKNFERNKVYATYINEYWQIDLLDYVSYSRQNSGYKYLTTIIDVFSKYLIVIPLKNKSMNEVTKKFNLLFAKIKPSKIQSDRGKEFDNHQFRKLCSDHGIIYFTTQNQTKKCAVVERVNRTLRIKIQRYMVHRGTYRYIDIIEKIVKGYNHSVHRSTEMKPIDVKMNDESKIFKKLYGAENMIEIMKQRQGDKKFETSDTVRVKFDERPLEKGYQQKWSDIVYKVRKVYNKLLKPQYSVSLNDQNLKRRYYPEELQKVSVENTNFQIDRILRYRRRENQREALIRWRGYGPEHDQWIPVTEIRNL